MNDKKDPENRVEKVKSIVKKVLKALAIAYKVYQFIKMIMD